MLKPTALRIVYIVDGDAPMREGLARLMDASGLEARPCASVSDFLGLARNGDKACVLLDMWETRHCEASERARLQSVAEALPVIALSSSDDPIVRRMARDLGAHSFFSKPVDAAALLDSIEWVMQGDGEGASHRG